MYSGAKVEGYTFDVAALRRALEEIDYDSSGSADSYNEKAFKALLNYFCDWSPEKANIESPSGGIHTEVSSTVDNLTDNKKEELYNKFCEELSKDLGDDTSSNDISKLANAIAENEVNDTQYDFIIRELWRFSKHLRDLDPRVSNSDVNDVQKLMTKSRSLPREYLDLKRRQYSDNIKINEIRSILLDRFKTQGETTVEELEEIAEDVNTNWEDLDILRNWSNFTIVAQIYYDFFKARIKFYMETLASRVLNYLPDEELTYHISSFQGSQNYVNTGAWMAWHTQPKESHKKSYQLFLGFYPESVRSGLHVGEEIRDDQEEWKEHRIISKFTKIDEIELQDILSSLDNVWNHFYELEFNGEPQTNLEDMINPPSFDLATDPPDGLFFEDWERLRSQIEASLNSGKNIILTGPPGTGKTKLAKWICEQAKQEDNIDGYKFTTATSDWTAFDTVGGYVPSADRSGQEIEFEPRIFLKCFRNEQNPVNNWLLIDEINRADIDKAFGQLFSVLSGDSVTLPYERDDIVEIAWIDNEEDANEVENNPDKFPVTPSWRLIATMNTHDKASLYEMSYAFMRRFNFVYVGVPDVNEELLDPSVKQNYVSQWIDEGLSEDIVERHYEQITDAWREFNKQKDLGPSVIKDIFDYIDSYSGDEEKALADAIVSLIYPQMEGMRPVDQKKLIENLGNVSEAEILKGRGEDMFALSFEDE